MDDEFLIEQVRQYEELYDTSKKNFNDYARRDVIWRKIARELNTTTAACKTRWISLRDQLRKIVRKKAAKRAPGARKLKKWKYEDCMSFLIPYFKVRESLSNKPLLEHTDEELDKNYQHQHNFFQDETRNSDETRTQNIFKRFKSATSTHSPSTIASPSINIRKAKKVDKIPTAIMQYLRDKSGSGSNVTNSHQIDLFFNGIAATVKNFSPEFQHMAKSRIFAVVSELELAHLQQ